MTPALSHLTADDLDDVVAGRTAPTIASHLDTCPSCAQMVAADRRLVAALHSLTSFDPSTDFASRVMRGISLAVPAPVLIVADSVRVRAARRRAVAALALAGGSLAAGFAWATAHPSDALRWSTPAVEGAGHALWVSLQQMVGTAIDQPWFGALRDSMTTPLRALLVTGALAGGYALALVGLRRLMTEPATDAGW